MATTSQLTALQILRAAGVFYRYELAIRDALFLQGRDPRLDSAHEQAILLTSFRDAKPVATAVLAITLSRDISRR